MKKAVFFSSIFSNFLLGDILCDFSIRGDYLFWSAMQDQMVYAETVGGQYPIVAGSADVDWSWWREQSNMKRQNSHFSSGARLVVGYNVGCIERVYAEGAWTTLHQHLSTEVDSNDYSILSVLNSTEVGVIAVETTTGSVLDPGIVQVNNHAKSKWHIAFDTVDILWGYQLCMSDKFTLSPNFGLKGAIIRQSQHVTYQDFNLNQFSSLDFYGIGSLTVHVSHNFQGVGPRIGVKGNLDLNFCHVSLYSHVATSFVYSKVDNTNTYSYVYVAAPITGGIFPPTNIRKNTLWLMRPTVEFSLGVEYKTGTMISLLCGYEAQLWFGQWNNVATYAQSYEIPSHLRGTLALQGLVVSTYAQF